MEATRTAGGTGPGVIAPDGSPVEFYSLLAAEDEPEIVAEAMGEHGSILELGSGPGRLTHALVDLGYEVVAVDESAAMLERVCGAERVCARIETLELGRRFDCVLLGSFLVNTPDAGQRAALLAACRRHVRDDGCVLVEWQPAQVQDSFEVGEGGTLRGIRVTLLALEHPAPGFAAVTMQYQAAGQTWTQSLVSQRLTDEDLRACLAQAGLRPDRYLTEDETWLRAVPDTGPPRQRSAEE
jgi:SAM-dependent methyltransferase